MSHVDEGALHAYLDGALDEYPPAEAERIRAHVDGCAECAARLDEERAIRSDAHAMLSLADPHVDAPSFEELRAYVQRTRQQRRGISRLQRLGWAASIVVAVGAGWMLREGQLQTRALDIGRSQPAVPGLTPQSDAAASPEEAERFGAREDAAAAVSVQRREVDAETRRSVAQGGAAEPLVARRPAVEAAEAERAALEADATGALVVTDAPTEKVDTDAGAVSARSAEPAAPSEEPSLEEIVLSANVVMADDSTPTGGSGAAGDATAAGATGVAAEPPPAVAADVVAAAGDPATEAQRRARTPEIVTLSSAVSADARDESGREQDVASLENEIPPEPLLSVPGHDVLDVTNLGEGTTPWGVRVRQRMVDGRTFEVFHLEPGIDPSILPALDDRAGEARAETAFGWVLVRGALPREELTDLLARLLPEAT